MSRQQRKKAAEIIRILDHDTLMGISDTIRRRFLRAARGREKDRYRRLLRYLDKWLANHMKELDKNMEKKEQKGG